MRPASERLDAVFDCERSWSMLQMPAQGHRVHSQCRSTTAHDTCTDSHLLWGIWQSALARMCSRHSRRRKRTVCSGSLFVRNICNAFHLMCSQACNQSRFTAYTDNSLSYACLLHGGWTLCACSRHCQLPISIFSGWIHAYKLFSHPWAKFSLEGAHSWRPYSGKTPTPGRTGRTSAGALSSVAHFVEVWALGLRALQASAVCAPRGASSTRVTTRCSVLRTASPSTSHGTFRLHSWGFRCPLQAHKPGSND